jgi:3-deoxy-manno-octulosonate cytidylyltransferase (CMP-KDO synthetase)
MGFYGYKRKFLLDFLDYGQSILEINENGVEMLRAMEHGHKVKLIDTTYFTIGVDYPEHIAEVEAWMDK